MASPRKKTSPAFGASLAIHVLALAAVRSVHVRSTAVAGDAAVEVDLLQEPASPLAGPTEPPSTESPPAVAAPPAVAEASALMPSAKRGESDAILAMPADEQPPSAKPAASGEAWMVPGGWTTPIDLGITNYWKEVAIHGPPPLQHRDEEVARREPATPSPNRILRDGLDAHDRALGLNPGSPLVSAARDAASPTLAPDVGSATFDVESNADGKVIAARVISASGDGPAWNDVGQELVKLMSSQNLHLPHDARGLRTRLRIVALRLLPSGAPAPMKAGAISEDACEGVGIHRRCGSGLPSGFSGGFDVADLGARSSRVVRVQLMSEVPL